ncbi:MAG: hypothetical protein JWO75_2226 [Actinomycetia bacterium]|nr:hypothetical protein [Actinomycetes bacterium]
MPALGAMTGALIAAGLGLGGGQALAATPAIPAAPLTGSASATLTQVSAAEWTTTIYLDTAALCAGSNSAGDEFSLVTSKPNSVTGAAAPAYPDGPLACVAAAANPVTEVTLTFTPSLSAVPLTAALTVTPPQALLLAGDPPLQVPLTVRRTVSPWQLVGIPAICGGALAVLLVLALVAMGMPGKGASQPAAPAKHEPVAPGQPVPPRQSGKAPQHCRVDYGVLLHLFLMTKRRELLVTEMPVTGGKGEEVAKREGVAKREAVAERAADEAQPRAGAGAGAGVRAKRVRWGLEFWRTPLFAAAAWSFGDSWATSVTPLTALAGGVITASGAVAGLVPGVDLTRIGLLMALVGGLTTLAPLLFGTLSSLFPERRAAEPVPQGEVIAASLWVMLLASCLTVFAIGAEIGFVGLVLGFDLIVVSPSIRWIGPVAAGLAAVLFLAYGAHSILTLTGQPSGTPKGTAKKSSFMM